MKMVAEYLERAHQFERLASQAMDDPELAKRLEAQAEAYRKLAAKRAEQLGLEIPAAAKPNVDRQ